MFPRVVTGDYIDSGFDSGRMFPHSDRATTTDPKGIVTQDTFDAAGRLTKEVADYRNGTPTDSSNQTTTYTYDSDDNLISQTAVMPAGEPSQTTQYVYGVSTTNAAPSMTTTCWLRSSTPTRQPASPAPARRRPTPTTPSATRSPTPIATAPRTPTPTTAKEG